MQTKTHRSTSKRFVTILVAACLVMSLGIVAYAVSSRILMNRSLTDDSNGSDYNVEYSFDPAENEFFDGKYWMPMTIPADYTTDYVSDYFEYDGWQSIMFKNAAGDMIEFNYQKAGPGNELSFEGVLSEEKITINDCSGVLIKMSHGNAVLWTNDTTGFGFMVFASDSGVDVMSIAESVISVDEPLTPTDANMTDKALETIGDYKPAYLPKGYIDNGCYGRPEMGEGDCYSYGYVRRYYVNQENNGTINFAYETYRLDVGIENTSENVLALYATGETMTVNGLPAVLSTGESGILLVWVDTSNTIVYTLYTNNVTSQELIAVANSIG